MQQSPFDGVDSPPMFDSFAPHGESVKVINDPIHGHFEVPTHALEFIDTPHVQRLRDLKQLGGTYLVYPGASQNRFEHSVGVSHLSAQWVRGLYASPRSPASCASIFDNERHYKQSLRLVRIAGLCHDLGHGPFSHLFDHRFLPVVDGGAASSHPHAQHEARSVMLLEHLIDTYALDYDRDAIRAISSLITGDRPAGGAETAVPRFLYDVVANQTCGIDTDRFDYIARDVYNVGLQGCYGFDHKRLMKFAKVVDDNICFHRKEIFNVYHLFLTRFQLHRTVYNHKAAIAIDAMLADILTLANPALRIADSIRDPVAFMQMTDVVLHRIEYSRGPALAAARDLVHRLRRRDLYSFVDEVLLPEGCARAVAPEDVTTCQPAGAVDLVPDDIVLATVTLNFGMKNQNPIDSVKFFRDWDDECPVHISSSKVSYVIPATFEEKILRLYLRRPRGPDTDRYKQAARQAFHAFLRRSNFISPAPSPTLPNGPKLNGARDPFPADPLGIDRALKRRREL